MYSNLDKFFCQVKTCWSKKESRMMKGILVSKSKTSQFAGLLRQTCFKGRLLMILIIHGCVSLDWRSIRELKVQYRPMWEDLWGKTFLLNQDREEMDLQQIRFWNCLKIQYSMSAHIIIFAVESLTVNQAWSAELIPANKKLWMDCTRSSQ